MGFKFEMSYDYYQRISSYNYLIYMRRKMYLDIAYFA